MKQRWKGFFSFHQRGRIDFFSSLWCAHRMKLQFGHQSIPIFSAPTMVLSHLWISQLDGHPKIMSLGPTIWRCSFWLRSLGRSWPIHFLGTANCHLMIFETTAGSAKVRPIDIPQTNESKEKWAMKPVQHIPASLDVFTLNSDGTLNCDCYW